MPESHGKTLPRPFLSGDAEKQKGKTADAETEEPAAASAKANLPDLRLKIFPGREEALDEVHFML